MYESDAQTDVSDPIVNGEVDRLNLAITDNELAVVVSIEDRNAAYTAQEARRLADGLEYASNEKWNGNNDNVIEYIRDLADVVDNEASVEQIEEKWDGQDIDLEL